MRKLAHRAEPRPDLGALPEMRLPPAAPGPGTPPPAAPAAPALPGPLANPFPGIGL
jgi:hypothetical protein